MSPPTPSTLDLPSHFPSFRRGQFELSTDLAVSPSRFSIVSAPTGSGKSLIAVTVARLLTARTLFLVGTKNLQSQFLRDFSPPPTNMVEIKGRANYTCPTYGNCAEAASSGHTCHRTQDGTCPYTATIREAQSADLVVANYAYWLSLARYSDPMALGEFDLLICDEAHTAADWVTNICQVRLARTEVEDLLGATGLPPKGEDDPGTWAKWAARSLPGARRLHRSTTDTHRKHSLSTLVQSLEDLAAIPSRTETRWVVEEVRRPGRLPDLVEISPVWPMPYTEDYLFRAIPRVILTSATVAEDEAKYLGIGAADFDYHEADSTFNHRRHPTYHLTTRSRDLKTRIDHRTGDGIKRFWVGRMDTIADAREEYRGIVHTRSYRRAREMELLSRSPERLLTHDWKGLNRALEEYRTSPPPVLLLSPSLEEGVDFPGDECRYVVIAKVPFPDTRGKLMKARVKDDDGYSMHLVSQALVQMSGRAMRGAEDWCEVWIIDDHWEWVRGKVTVPKWWRKTWRTVTEVPGEVEADQADVEPRRRRGRR